jgi:peptidoglycan/xylan/chitin deacetylase (PgdA/CDA1 family)
MTAPFILNFHGVGEATARTYEEGEQPYWIDIARFRAILDTFAAPIRAGAMRITFDDGNASDAEIAAPELLRRGMTASFFVLAGKLDQPGYLSSRQVRALDVQGFTIGSHGLHHRVWPMLDSNALTAEIAESKAILSELVGGEIDTAALPFGRYDRRVLSALNRAGYRTIYSSDGSPRLSDVAPLPRFSVRCDTTNRTIQNRLEAIGFGARARQELKITIKALR